MAGRISSIGGPLRLRRCLRGAWPGQRTPRPATFRPKTPRPRTPPPKPHRLPRGPPLSTQQQQVLDRFSELEKKLLRMAELTAATDPHRAALLRKAVAQSKQQGIEAQLAQLVELLGQERLAPAVKNQAAVEQDLNRLLQLLLSEDRSKRLQSEKERIGNNTFSASTN